MQENIKKDLDLVVNELKSQGINPNTKPDEYEGLGDAVEKILNKVGITQERFKEFFGLEECNCTLRKQYLNGILKWKKKS